MVSRRDAVADVMDHTSTSVNYHKIVLSPSQDEPVPDWREWTREIMHDLEEQQGKELHWYAVHHANTDNPHVHVVVAGAGENHETGKLEPVKLYERDYQAMRESGHEHSDHEWLHQIERYVREYDQREQAEFRLDRSEPGTEREVDQDQDRGR